MSFRDLFTAVASAFAPMARNQTVHDMQSIKQAAMNGQELVIRNVRRRHAAWQAGDRDAVCRADEKQSEVISALDDLARRLNK